MVQGASQCLQIPMTYHISECVVVPLCLDTTQQMALNDMCTVQAVQLRTLMLMALASLMDPQATENTLGVLLSCMIALVQAPLITELHQTLWETISFVEQQPITLTMGCILMIHCSLTSGSVSNCLNPPLRDLRCASAVIKMWIMKMHFSSLWSCMYNEHITDFAYSELSFNYKYM